MGPLATANQQIREAERASGQQRLARMSAPHRLTDRLLDQLEELNLDEVRLVPETLAPILAELRGQLLGYHGITNRQLDRLQVGTRTPDLIETIFAIQEVIAPPTLPQDDFPFDESALV